MFSALFSFLGGSAFRFLIGRATEWLEKRQEHLQEMERLRLESQLANEAHTRQKELIQLQSDLKLTEIKLVGENAVSLSEADAFKEAMKVANTPTGIKWIDGWNGTIRPAAASIALSLWALKVIKAALVLTDWDSNLVASILGYYFADRNLGKRGK
jgi:hypothetical protein